MYLSYYKQNFDKQWNLLIWNKGEKVNFQRSRVHVTPWQVQTWTLWASGLLTANHNLGFTVCLGMLFWFVSVMCTWGTYKFWQPEKGNLLDKGNYLDGVTIVFFNLLNYRGILIYLSHPQFFELSHNITPTNAIYLPSVVLQLVEH